MKKKLLFGLFFIVSFIILLTKASAQQCNSGGCTVFPKEYPTVGAPYTPPSSWQVLNNPATGNAALMNGGNWTRFNVVAGNKYEWTYCESYGGVSISWDPQLTLFDNSNTTTPICYSTDAGGTCGLAPYISWTATFTGVVRLLTTAFVSGVGTCLSNSGATNKLAYRQVAGTSCTYSIFPSSVSPSSTSGSGSVSVTTTTGCSWTAVSNNTSWLSVTSGSSGTGNGTVNYSFTTNGLSTSRTGTITIAGKTFTVTQAGTVSCSYSILPASNSPFSASGNGSISVTATPGCSWTAISNNTSWLTVTSGSSGTGNGTVNYSYTANGLSTSRTGTITIAGNSFSVTQAGTNSSSQILGIDVSHWQGTINWMNSYKIFAFVKATEGVTYNDPKFSENMLNGKIAKVVMGAYHFARPDNNSAIDEANHFLNIASSFIGPGYLPPALDLENIEDGNGNVIYSLKNMTSTELTAWVQTWMTTVQNATGVLPILYTTSEYTTYLNSSLNTYKLWIAKYETAPNTPPTGLGVWNTWAFKQYSKTGTVAGIYPMDLDIFNGDLTAFNNLISGTPITPPSNDNCSGAELLTPSSTCTYISRSTLGATQSVVATSPCNGFTNGNADDDVWFKFSATAGQTYTVRLLNGTSFDGVLDLRSGSCNGTSIACNDQTGSTGILNTVSINPTTSQTYYVRVYHYGTGSGGGNFQICVEGSSSPTATITNFNIAPATVCPGGTFTITNTVNASATINNVILGASIAPAGTSSYIDNISHDLPVSLPSGISTQIRSFTVPPGITPGIYDVVSGLWKDMNANGVIDPLVDVQLNSLPKAGLLTITACCTSPTANVNSPSGSSPLTMTCTASGGSGGAIAYKWYNGTSCSGTVLGTNSTLSVTTGGSYTCKAYITGFESTCFTCVTGNATITSTCTAPTTQATNVAFPTGGTNSNSIQLNWTNGSGTGGRMVVAKVGTPLTGIPVNGTTYTANLAFGSGNSIATGEYVVYNGTGSGPITVTNLSPLTIYYFKVFEYNCTGSTITYQSNNALSNPNSHSTTCTKPSTPGVINGTSSVCIGTSQLYFVSDVPGASSYTWNLPNGWTGISDSRAITVVVGSSGGVISVTANNTCGSSSPSSLAVSSVSPVTPTISISQTSCTGNSISFNSIITNGGNTPAYSWTFTGAGTATSGNTGPTFTLNNASNGTQVQCVLTSSVTCVNATQATSGTLTVSCIATAVPTINGLEYFKISPNPSSGTFNIRIKLNGSKDVSFKLFNLAGQVIYASAPSRFFGTQIKEIDGNKLPSGVYFLETKIGMESFVEKIVILR